MTVLELEPATAPGAGCIVEIRPLGHLTAVAASAGHDRFDSLYLDRCLLKIRPTGETLENTLETVRIGVRKAKTELHMAVALPAVELLKGLHRKVGFLHRHHTRPQEGILVDTSPSF